MKLANLLFGDRLADGWYNNYSWCERKGALELFGIYSLFIVGRKLPPGFDEHILAYLLESYVQTLEVRMEDCALIKDGY